MIPISEFTGPPGVLDSPEEVLSTLTRDGKRKWVYPFESRGRYWKARRIVGWVLIAFFVALPIVRIGGKPAVFLDVLRREFTFFGTTFYPTDTFLLLMMGIASLLVIILVTALWGRVWCGWGCPQTVYMEFVFRPLENLIEGPPARRQRRDAKAKSIRDVWAAWRLSKQDSETQAGFSAQQKRAVAMLSKDIKTITEWMGRRAVKLSVFTLISVFLAHTFVAYFAGWHNLIHWMTQPPAEHWGYFVLMAFTSGLVLFDFAYFREQMCTIACPYARLQSALVDEDSLIVSYDPTRGEPRGKRRRTDAESPLGDCIDCGACVRTCPTGIDIRDGLQMECIACTQCIDACDPIMDKIGKPRGLIRYTSERALEGKDERTIRPRTIVYGLLIVLISSLFVMALLQRGSYKLNVGRAVSTEVYTALPDGSIANRLRFRVHNLTDETRTFTVAGIEPST
ncbi:MAG: 4Fe-4S dicluster domain-containing protein, partial [Bacteroidota bacterium]